MVSADSLPAILKKLQKAHTHAEVSVTSGTSEELVKKILAGEMDAAFVSLPVQARNVETELLSQDQLVAIASPRHATGEPARRERLRPRGREAHPRRARRQHAPPHRRVLRRGGPEADGGDGAEPAGGHPEHGGGRHGRRHRAAVGGARRGGARTPRALVDRGRAHQLGDGARAPERRLPLARLPDLHRPLPRALRRQRARRGAEAPTRREGKNLHEEGRPQISGETKSKG